MVPPAAPNVPRQIAAPSRTTGKITVYTREAASLFHHFEAFRQEFDRRVPVAERIGITIKLGQTRNARASTFRATKMSSETIQRRHLADYGFCLHQFQAVVKGTVTVPPQLADPLPCFR
jgi:hypothetical protein